MRQLGVRHRILAFALALVVTTQLVVVLPALYTIGQDAEIHFARTVDLAGKWVDEHMNLRAQRWLTAVNELLSEDELKQVLTDGRAPDLGSVLGDIASRLGAAMVVLLGPDGSPIESWTESGAPLAVSALVPFGEALEDQRQRIIDIDGVSYHTVMAAFESRSAAAWIVLGFSIDEALARHLRSVTGLEVSFVSRSRPHRVIASTLDARAQGQFFATADLEPDTARLVGPGEAAWWTLVRPVLERNSDLYVAMQQSSTSAKAPSRRFSQLLWTVTVLSLVLAIAGSIWLVRAITGPLQKLAAAAERMREGIYTEPADLSSADDLEGLASSFNAMQQAIAEREKQIFRQAHHDSLTGLPNRELVIGLLRDAIDCEKTLSVVSVGLDRFTRIVAAVGHRAGDEIFASVAQAIRNRLEGTQVLGHLGDHEFIIGLPGVDCQEAVQWTEQLVNTLRSGIQVRTANISVHATVGVACSSRHGTDAAELCRRASSARHDAMQRHATIAVFELGREEQSLQKIKLMGDFSRALANDELMVHFQPKLDLRSGIVHGGEALVRWQHPNLGLLMPDAFVGAIEQAGRIAHLTRWVLRSAAAYAGRWRQQGCDLGIAVNIAAEDLVDEYLPYFLLDLTKKHRLAPQQLTLEVTESAIMHDLHKSFAVVSCIHELGFRIAVDDFGTGHSALAELRRLPVQELKIDKTFVTGVRGSKDYAILRSTINLAHELGLSVVAEGVETDAALEMLSELGCDYAQGYCIGRPMSAEAFFDAAVPPAVSCAG